MLRSCFRHRRGFLTKKGFMKKVLITLGIPLILLAALIYWVYQRRQNAAIVAANTVQNTTNSQTGIFQWFPGFDGFTSAALENLGGSISLANQNLTAVSNAFGLNDGGANPGVSVGGASAGGLASSGSGVGLPSALSNVSDIFSTVFNNDDYSLSPLNNFDVLNTPQTIASANAANTTIYGADDSDTLDSDDD
jgi:hypothetical protein